MVATIYFAPEDVLALDPAGSKSLFASRQGLLGFARVCDVAQPEDVIRSQLQALEVLARFAELSERAPNVVAAIRRCAAPFITTFG